MADFIAPIVDWLIGVVQGADFATPGLEPFAECRKSWTGVCVNWPPCAVMALGTDFDPEGTAIRERHQFTIKFGVNGDDPDQVAVNAMAYMTAIDRAVAGACGAWPEAVSNVFVSRHDFGPLFAKDGAFAKFPEMHLEVDAYEV